MISKPLNLNIREVENGYVVYVGDSTNGGCMNETYVASSRARLAELVENLALDQANEREKYND